MDYTDIIRDCKTFLAKPVPNTESDLEDAIIALETLRLPILEARVATQTDLSLKRRQYLHPRDKDFTNLDREIMLAANTTEQTELFELLRGLEYLLKDRHATLSLLLDI
jgi:hypothetical protein